MTDPIKTHPRGLAAMLTGIAGGATAQTMSLWGADIARFLPPMFLLTIAACAGAAVAGAIMVWAFGRHGPAGVVLAMLAWPLTTMLGAVFASIPFGLLEVGLHGNALVTLLKATEAGAPLGLFAVVSGISGSPQAVLIWVLSAVVIHSNARVARQLTT